MKLGASRYLLAPFQALSHSCDRAAGKLGYAGIGVLMLGLGAGWWIYVPLHELAHAFACIWTGGTVDRLEIAPEFGAALLANWLPFVAVGSDYAGQLTGFDTGNNDAIYLATVLGPYVLTLFPGIPALVWSNQIAQIGYRQTLLAGASLSWALAPFIALPGDMYEAGSIIVTHWLATMEPGMEPLRWRSDDIFLLVNNLYQQGATLRDWAIAGASQLVGIVIAYLVYTGGMVVARLLVSSRLTQITGPAATG